MLTSPKSEFLSINNLIFIFWIALFYSCC
jgi:hypothetical protein